MTTKDILRYGIELTAFVLSAFGGFLRAIAPPQEAGAALSVGLASFSTLVVFLFVVAISKGKNQKSRKTMWLRISGVLACVALISAFAYISNSNKFTFRYPPPNGERYMAGTQFTKEGQMYWDQLQDLSQVVLKFGLSNRAQVWTPDSINRAQLLLTLNYVILVISLTGTVFALSEGVLAGSSFRKGRELPNASSPQILKS
jgi:hypothetical protein